jgi:hypothetical protein
MFTDSRQGVARWGPVLTEASVRQLLELDYLRLECWWAQYWPNLLFVLERGTLEAASQLVTLLVDEFCELFGVEMTWAMAEDERQQLAGLTGGSRPYYEVSDVEAFCRRMYRHAALNKRESDGVSKGLNGVLSSGLFRGGRGSDDGEEEAVFEDAEEVYASFTVEQWNGLFFAFALQTVYGVFTVCGLPEYLDSVRELYLRWGVGLYRVIVGPPVESFEQLRVSSPPPPYASVVLS